MAPNGVPTSAKGYVSEWLTTLSSGLGFLDTLEQIPDLIWPASIQTYGRMRNDPQLQAILSAVTLPLRRGSSWSVDPAGCRGEVAQLVADDLGLPVLGAEDVPGAARRRGVRWDEHLRLALLSLVYGFMPFETIYEIRDGQARLRMLSERMPHTIFEIDVNDDGTLRGLRQGAPNSELIGADRLAMYVHDREGAAWMGRSMLRPAYGAWLYKHEMLRILATSNRRFGMGVPSVEAPPGATPVQVAEAQRLATSIRVGDQSGVGLPPGFKLNLTGITGGTPDTLGAIRYLDEQMSKSALAGVLDLSQTRNGSRALGSELVDLMMMAWQAIADDVADTATGLSVQMVTYNWGDAEPAPRIVVSDIGSRHEVTAEAIAMLMSAGAVTPDPALEEYVRDRWRLPQRSTPQPPPGTEPAPSDVAPAGPVVPQGDQGPVKARARSPRSRRTQAATAADDQVGHRQPTLIEAAAQTDFGRHQKTWEAALAALVISWKSITRRQRQVIADQIQTAVDDGDLERLAALAVDSTDAARLLAERMLTVANDAADEMETEAELQGVTVDDVPEVDSSHLDAVAAAVAALLAAGMATAAGRKAIQTVTTGSSGADVASAVEAHLEALTDTFLADQLGGALSAAQNLGRFTVLDVAPDAMWVASEILDQNTCKPCAGIDGTQFDTLDEARQAYGSGGYTGCAGGPRCRGMLVAVWDTQALEDAA